MGENTPQKPPRGVNCANWGSFAYRPRRKTAVCPADPMKVIAIFRIIWYNKKNTESFRRIQF